ncbi:hypothetical protein HK101_002707 [Irineochytrium annulatum]|nr:hypothetical protein HK101_002707 [Irineochytrium annulatum]
MIGGAASRPNDRVVKAELQFLDAFTLVLGWFYALSLAAKSCHCHGLVFSYHFTPNMTTPVAAAAPDPRPRSPHPDGSVVTGWDASGSTALPPANQSVHTGVVGAQFSPATAALNGTSARIQDTAGPGGAKRRVINLDAYIANISPKRSNRTSTAGPVTVQFPANSRWNGTNHAVRSQGNGNNAGRRNGGQPKPRPPPQPSHAIVYNAVKGEADYKSKRLEPAPRNTLASRMLPSGLLFLFVDYEGDPNNLDQLKAYASFLHTGGSQKLSRWSLLTYSTGHLATRRCVFAPRKLCDSLRVMLGLPSFQPASASYGKRVPDPGKKMPLAKYIKYSGLLFNEIQGPILMLKNVTMVMGEDVERHGFTFTDGCGRISTDLIEELVPGHRRSRKDLIPTAIQMRAPGIKGMLVADPLLERRTVVLMPSMRKLRVKEVPVGIVKDGRVDDNAVISAVDGGQLRDLIDCDSIPVGILAFSKPQTSGILNSQIITLLLERGVSSTLLLNMDTQYKQSMRFMITDVMAALDFLHLRGMRAQFLTVLSALRAPEGSATRELKLRTVWRQLRDLQANEVANWRKREAAFNFSGWGKFKAEEVKDEDVSANDPMRRVYLPCVKSRRLYGVADHWESLGPGECFVRITNADGEPVVIEGDVLVVRNPCYHAGDIIRLKAVRGDEQVAHCLDVIVFSCQGERPDPDKSSGGDLDGDSFIAIWDERLLEAVVDMKPFNYRPDAMKDLVKTTSLRLGELKGLRPKKAANLNKTSLIDKLTSLDTRDKIAGKIDGLFNACRKSDPPTPDDAARPILTRQELIAYLNALFSIGIDDVDLDMEQLLKGVEREVKQHMSSALSTLSRFLESCIQASDSTSDLIKRQTAPDSLEVMFGFFVLSVDEDQSWQQPGFEDEYVVPERRETVDLTLKILKMGEKLIMDEPAVTSLLDVTQMEVLRKFFKMEVVNNCAKVIRRREEEIEIARRACLDVPVRGLIEMYSEAKRKVAKMQEEYDRNGELNLLHELEEEKMKLDALHKEMYIDPKQLTEYNDKKKVWKELDGRHLSIEKVVKHVVNALSGKVKDIDSKLILDVETIFMQEINMFGSELPIYNSRAALVDFCTAGNTRCMLILAETGSGKSTCCPHFVANELFFQGLLSSQKPIIVAQPRRQATTSLAAKLAETRSSNLGDAVGSHIGKSKAVTNKFRTVINCTTYGILLSYASRDPAFLNYSVIILDEVHEDSPDLYFLFSIIKMAMRRNSELRMILMSAKVNAEKLQEFFGECDVLTVKGRAYPIQEHFLNNFSNQPDKYIQNALDAVADIHASTPVEGNCDILVADIDIAAAKCREAVRDKLGDEAATLYAYPLYSSLDQKSKDFILKRLPVDQWPDDANDGDADSDDGGNDDDETLELSLEKLDVNGDAGDADETVKMDDAEVYANELMDATTKKNEVKVLTQMLSKLASEAKGVKEQDSVEDRGAEDEKTADLVKAEPGNVDDKVAGEEEEDSSSETSDHANSDASRVEGYEGLSLLVIATFWPKVIFSATEGPQDSPESGKVELVSKNEIATEQPADAESETAANITTESDNTAAENADTADTDVKKPLSKRQRKLLRLEEKAKRRIERVERRRAEKEAAKVDTTRRVIFCTNVAETSLTFPRIGYVVDSGLQFRVRQQAQLGIRKVGLESTSAVSALQRKGRAGRLGPGVCYRLFSAEDLEDFEEQTFSDSDRLDMTILQIIEMHDIRSFEWFHPPSASDLEWTLEVLVGCGFADHDHYANVYHITRDGDLAVQMGRIGLPAQAIHFLLASHRATDDELLRAQCVVVAALNANGLRGQLVTRNFSYRHAESMAGSDYVDEDYLIACPETMETIPATAKLVNLYWTFASLPSKSARKKWCEGAKVHYRRMKDVATAVKEIADFIKRRDRDFAFNGGEWYFDEETWVKFDGGVPLSEERELELSAAEMATLAEYSELMRQADEDAAKRDNEVEEDEDANDVGLEETVVAGEVIRSVTDGDQLVVDGVATPSTAGVPAVDGKDFAARIDDAPPSTPNSVPSSLTPGQVPAILQRSATAEDSNATLAREIASGFTSTTRSTAKPYRDVLAESLRTIAFISEHLAISFHTNVGLADGSSLAYGGSLGPDAGTLVPESEMPFGVTGACVANVDRNEEKNFDGVGRGLCMFMCATEFRETVYASQLDCLPYGIVEVLPESRRNFLQALLHSRGLDDMY